MTEMTPAEAVYFAAAALPAADRAAYLDRACAGNDELRRLVERMLAARAEVGEFLEPPQAPPSSGATATFNPNSGGRPGEATGTFGPGTNDSPTASFAGRGEHVGSVIAGKYKLMEEIGEGGMGSVFMAQQTEPVKRAVAVKVIKAGMDSKAVVARFDAERQALALMDHPSIAKVLDAGTTEAGRPFFVKERLTGVPITQFCNERKLTVRQRLDLFVQVCHAIQHAHQKGIIHRDIKPSNVLVALYDDKPVPKVIDFGIAKAAGPSLTDMTLMTGFGAVVGTPEYMSPEQASLNNLDIDTRSDVYALGVLLYELLTGSTPVDRKSLGKAALLEILRLVREVEVPRPSAKLSTLAILPSVAAQRGTEPGKLSKMLRSELDWVLLKALEKDRTRRYESANGFAADVQRYLDGEAVQAHPPSTAYKLNKFVRRNKGQVIAASVVFTTLVAGMAGTTWGLFEAKKQEELAREETKEKEAARAAEAERVAERDLALGKEKAALGREAERADELKHRLGISQFVLANAALDKRDVALAAERLDLVPPEQRGWGWRHLKQQAEGGIFTLKDETATNESGVFCVAYSPDGGRIATGHVSLEKSKPVRVQGVVREGYPFVVRVWDAWTGQLLRKVTSDYGSEGASVSFSPDGKRLLRGGAMPIVWDAETGAVQLELKGEPSSSHAAFSPDGSRIVTGSVGGQARVWDARSGAALVTLTGARNDSLSYSPDGKRIVGCNGSTLRVWDAEKEGPPLFERKNVFANSASFSPDGTRILISSIDGTARVLNAADGTALLPPLKHRRASQSNPLTSGDIGGGRMSAAFSPDGTRVVTTGSEEVRVWDARTGRELFELIGHRRYLSDAAFSPDGTRIVTGSSDGTAKVWDARTGVPRIELRGLPQTITGAAFSPDGTRVVTGNGIAYWHYFAEQGVDGKLARPVSALVWDSRTGKPVLELRGEHGYIQAAAFSPDGARIVTGGWRDDDWREDVWRAELGANFPPRCRRGHATVWDAKTGARLLELKGLKSGVYSVAFSADGKYIATGGTPPDLGDKNEVIEVKVWNAETGAVHLDLSEPLPPKAVLGVNPIQRGASVAFSPDGAKIVVAGLRRSQDESRLMRPGTPQVYDARTGKELFKLRIAEAGSSPIFISVAYSPDGTRIVASEGTTARVWDVRSDTSALPIALKGHTGEVLGAAFSPDGKLIVTASTDGTARVWDARTGTTLVELPADIGQLASVAFSPDGTRLVAGGVASTGGGGPGTPVRENVRAVMWEVPPPATGSKPNAEELAYRRAKAEPNVERFLAGYVAAKRAKDDFATKYFLNLIPETNRKELVAHAEMAALHARAAELRNRPESEPVLKELLELQKSHLGPDHLETIDVLLQLARFKSNRDEEVRLLNTQLDLMKAKFGPASQEVLSERTKLGDLYQRMGQIENAITQYKQVVNGYSVTSGPNHPQTIGAIFSLSKCYRDAGRAGSAIAMLESIRTAPINYTRVADALVEAYRSAGEDEKAVRLLLNWRGELRKEPPADDGRERPEYSVTAAWNNLLGNIAARLGEIELKRKNWVAVETYVREAVAHWNWRDKGRSLDPKHGSMLHEALMRQQKYAEAEPLLLESYKTLSRSVARAPQFKPILLDTLDHLIELYTATNKPDEAKKYRAERAKYPNEAPPPREKK